MKTAGKPSSSYRPLKTALMRTVLIIFLVPVDVTTCFYVKTEAVKKKFTKQKKIKKSYFRSV